MTFDMLVVTTPEEKLERDEMFAQCSSQQELGTHFNSSYISQLKIFHIATEGFL